MSSMRLTNKEKSLLAEFTEITDFNNKLCEEFLMNNLIDNKYFEIRWKSDIEHQTHKYFKRFDDIIEKIKYTDIYSFVSLHNKEKSFVKGTRNISGSVNIYQYGYNKTVIPNRTNIIYSNLIVEPYNSNYIYSLEEFKKKNQEIENNVTDLFNTFDLIKENYITKFEEFKTQFKSYDEVFKQYEILVNNWNLKNR